MKNRKIGAIILASVAITAVIALAAFRGACAFSDCERKQTEVDLINMIDFSKFTMVENATQLGRLDGARAIFEFSEDPANLSLQAILPEGFELTSSDNSSTLEVWVGSWLDEERCTVALRDNEVGVIKENRFYIFASCAGGS